MLGFHFLKEYGTNEWSESCVKLFHFFPFTEEEKTTRIKTGSLAAAFAFQESRGYYV
jgi:hypothetical protein